MTQLTQLGDRYDVGQVIGRGGMAEVYEGTDRRLNRRVAIKVLRADLARDPLFQERFRREAQSAAGLNHPNIVAIYDTGEDTVVTNGTAVTIPYIVMEQIEGVTLRHMLQNGPRILPERALEIVAGVLAALDYAHRNGIVHRDIKPANIMINTHGDAKVMDFGIARAISDAATSVTATSAVMGTAQYLSPEQARGEVADARSDIYSAGCVLYELLTGRPPFNGETPVAIAYQHVNEAPVPPSSVDPSIPETLSTIVLHALSKNPSTRYQTAAEMRADVERSIAGMPITAVIANTMNQATTAIPTIAGATTALPIINGGETKKRSKGPLIAGGLAVVGVIAGMLLVITQLFGGGNSNVTVPDLKGKTVAQAELALTNVGLSLGVQNPQSDDNAPKGTIIGQDPAVGELIERGQAINITVSNGPEQTTVPDLVDLTNKDDARVALVDARLILGKVTEKDSDKPEGTVLSQSVKAGESVDVGTSVDITVSSGKVKIPDVMGLTKTKAQNALINAGFKVDLVFEPSDQPEGTVIGQTPDANTLAIKGFTVTLTIASPAASPTAEPSVSPTP